MTTATIGSKIFVGTNKPTAALVDYNADTFTEIHAVNDLGEAGDSAEEIKFETIEDGRVQKFKGAFDAGNLELTVGRSASDPGQLKLRAALHSPDAINFKIVFPDAPPGGTPTTKFFKARVMAGKTKMGQANNVITETFTLGITSELLIVEAAA